MGRKFCCSAFLYLTGFPPDFFIWRLVSRADRLCTYSWSPCPSRNRRNRSYR